MAVTYNTVREFMGVAHGNLARVKELLAEFPELLDICYAWGHANTERPIQAGAHVGNRPIVEFLLEQGAPMDICVAAMLGRKEEVARILQEDPSQVHTTGGHSIPLMNHVALGGNIEIAEMVLAHGGGEGLPFAIIDAVSLNHPQMVEWLIAHGATDFTVKNFQGKTLLTIAVERGYAEVEALLRQHGAVE